MKPNNKIITLAFCLLLVLAVHVFATDSVTITGILYASAWNSNDNPTEVVIMNEAGDFAVVNNEVGQQLLRLAGKDIQVNAVVKKDDEGRQTITVLNYTLMTD